MSLILPPWLQRELLQASPPHLLAFKGGAATDLRRTANVPDDILFTACGFAILTSDANTWGNIVSLEDGTSSASAGIYLQTAGDGTTLNILGVSGQVDTAVATLTLGRPFFWAVTSSGTTTLFGHYMPVGAKTLTSVQAPGTRGGTTPVALFIGNDSYGEPWPGRIWGVRVWDAVLSTAELLREARQLLPVRLHDLNAVWPAARSGQIGQPLLDLSRYQRTLTATGSLAWHPVPNVVPWFDARYAAPELLYAPTAGGPGAQTATLGGVAEAERAGGLAIAAGVVTLQPGGQVEAERAGGLAIAAGAVTLQPGGQVEAERAGGVAIAAGAVTLQPGGHLERELPGGLAASVGAIVATLGGNVEAERAGGLAAAAGVVTLQPGGAVERELPGGLTATAGLVLQLGGAVEAERAGGLAIAAGAVTLQPGGHLERELPGGLAAAAGAAQITVGGNAERERAGGLAASSGLVLALGGGLEAERAGGLAIAAGAVTLRPGGHVERELPGGLAAGFGVGPQTIELGGHVERERAGGLVDPARVIPADAVVSVAGGTRPAIAVALAERPAIAVAAAVRPAIGVSVRRL